MISVFQKLTDGVLEREPFVQRERGRKQGDVLRKLQVALDGCGSGSWSPGYVWGVTEEGS